MVPRRVRALAYLWYGGLDPLYRRLPMAARTTALHLQRGKLSPELAQALQQEVGPGAWAWLTGATDTLTDEAGRIAP